MTILIPLLSNTLFVDLLVQSIATNPGAAGSEPVVNQRRPPSFFRPEGKAGEQPANDPLAIPAFEPPHAARVAEFGPAPIAVPIGQGSRMFANSIGFDLAGPSRNGLKFEAARLQSIQPISLSNQVWNLDEIKSNIQASLDLISLDPATIPQPPATT